MLSWAVSFQSVQLFVQLPGTHNVVLLFCDSERASERDKRQTMFHLPINVTRSTRYMSVCTTSACLSAYPSRSLSSSDQILRACLTPHLPYTHMHKHNIVVIHAVVVVVAVIRVGRRNTVYDLEADTNAGGDGVLHVLLTCTHACTLSTSSTPLLS